MPNTDDHLRTQSSPTTLLAAGIDQVISLPVQPIAAAEAVTLTPAQAETSPSNISITHAPAAATQAHALCPTQEVQAANRDQPHMLAQPAVATVDEDAAAAHHQTEGSNRFVMAIQQGSATSVAPLAEAIQQVSATSSMWEACPWISNSAKE